MFIFGTRPEVIKFAPLIEVFEKSSKFKVVLCSTGQQRELLDQMVKYFELNLDYELKVMKENQNLSDLTSTLLPKLTEVLEKERPDHVFVHGDTTTAFVSSLAAFYQKIDVSHIEAGLRTNNIYSPYPEEMNRCLISKIASYNFAPTEMARLNLLKEGVSDKKIFVTGNTGIDAVLQTKKKILSNDQLPSEVDFDLTKKFILITYHRRENHGEDLLSFVSNLKLICEANPDYNFVLPVHLNPNIKKPFEDNLKDISNIILRLPFSYEAFVWCLTKCHFIISDSGGVQEEATALGKPVLLYRDTTERPEGIECKNIILVKEGDLLRINVNKLLKDVVFYHSMSVPSGIFGDGKASERILRVLEG